MPKNRFQRASEMAEEFGFTFEDAPGGMFILRSQLSREKLLVHQPLTLQQIESNLRILKADQLPPLP